MSTLAPNRPLTRYLPAILLAIATVTVPAAANARQETAGPDLVVRHVALQVEHEPDYQASDLTALLSLDSYMGAIAPNLVSATERAVRRTANLPCDDLVTLEAKQGSPEILTLSFRGSDAQLVNSAVEHVVNHLLGIVPTRRRSNQELLERARVDLEEANRMQSAVMQLVGEFTAKNGEDCEQVLIDSQNSVRNRRSELNELQDRGAVLTATRDYLREAITARRASLPNGSAETRAELEKLHAELDDLATRKSPTSPDMKKVNEQITRLAAQAATESGGPDPVLQQLESRLFGVEEDVFAFERRREWLAKQIEDATKSAREVAGRCDAWRALRDRSNRAKGRVEDLSSLLATMERDRARTPSGPWIRVIAK